MKNTTLIALVAGALSLSPASGGPARADDGVTTPANVLTSVAAGQGMRMEYELEASAWVFILPVTGKASFDVMLKPDGTYAMTSVVRTTGLADVLVDYDMRLAASGYVRPDGLQTYAYTSQNHDGKKNRRVELVYGDTDVAMTATPAFGNLGDPVATPAQKMETSDPITTLISYGLEPRGTTPEEICGGPMRLFDGKQLTHFRMSYAGTKRIRTKAWSGEAIECHIAMDKVAGYKAGEVNRDTLTGIDGPLRMWLAPLPNGSYVPVKIQADTDKIGKVTLQASKLRFTPVSAQ